jgi:glycosyltransferase involved in cell wall biosynthesis
MEKRKGVVKNISIENIQASENIENSPLVSVVIPIYDRTNLLIESIESILKQTFRDYELLLVCDGSPQETLEIVKTYEKKVSNIRAFYFSENSGNAVRGRNKGIKEAKGEYIAFQDSDDVADSKRLERSIKAIERTNADLIYGGWKAIVDGSRNINIRNGQKIFPRKSNFDILLKTNPICQSTVMARVEALRDVGGFNPKMEYREDHELWLRLAYHGYKFKAIRKILTHLRLHEGNLELKFKQNDDHWYHLMLETYKEKIRLE